MSRFALALVVSAVLCALPATAFATTVVVPDDFPTIQQAVDSGAEVVLVRGGRYPEHLVTRGSVRIEAVVDLLGRTGGAPEIGGLTVEYPGVRESDPIDSCSFSGLRFRGPVRVAGSGNRNQSEFVACRLDSGLAAPGFYRFDRIRLSGCIVYGGADLSLSTLVCRFTTFFDGGLKVFCEFTAEIDNNVVMGTKIGIDLRGPPAEQPRLTNNVVTNADVGIHVIYADGAIIEGNDVSHCAEAGILCESHRPVVHRNRVRHVGGGGIVAPSATRADGNLVEDCLGGGIMVHDGSLRDNTVRRVGGVGIDALWASDSIVRNTVLDAGGDGLRGSAYDISYNTIGRCGGDGLSGSAGRAHHNTSFSNVGSGFKLAANYIDHNIAFQNGAFGLDLVQPPSPELSCNDWFQNDSGATRGTIPGPTDLDVDPLFCNLASDSVTLRNDSPLLDALGCGLIGADSLGCADGTTETIEPGGPSPEPSAFGLELSAPFPNPTGRATRLSFTLPERMRVRLTVLDVQGREVARLVDGEMSAGPHEATWSAASAGAYFVRLEAGDRRMVRRAFVLR